MFFIFIFFIIIFKSRIDSLQMGQTPSSVCTPNVSTTSATSGRRRSFRSPFSRRKKLQKPLSATFHVPDSYNASDSLNINLATVEQVSDFNTKTYHMYMVFKRKYFPRPVYDTARYQSTYRPDYCRPPERYRWSFPANR